MKKGGWAARICRGGSASSLQLNLEFNVITETNASHGPDEKYFFPRRKTSFSIGALPCGCERYAARHPFVGAAIAGGWKAVADSSGALASYTFANFTRDKDDLAFMTASQRHGADARTAKDIFRWNGGGGEKALRGRHACQHSKRHCR